jgi:hypothetical protein
VTKDQESGDTHTIWNANKVSLKRKKKRRRRRSFIIKKKTEEKPVCMFDEEGVDMYEEKSFKSLSCRQ